MAGATKILITWSIVISSVTCASGASHNNTPTLEPNLRGIGIIFQLGPEAIFSSTSWTIAFDVNVTGLEMQLQELNKQYQEEQEVVNNLKNLRLGYNTTDEIIRNALRRAGKDLTNLYFQVDGTRNIKDVNAPRRKGRRSIPGLTFIGSLSNTLFGTATEDDVARLQAQIDYVMARQASMASTQELQLTAFKTLEGQIRETEVRLQQEVNVTKVLLDMVKHLYEVPREGGKEQVLFHLIWQEDMLASINLFRTIIHQLGQALKNLQDGYITPELIEPDSLEKAMEFVQKELPPHLRLAVSTNAEDLKILFRIQIAQHLEKKGVIRGIIRIPLTTTGQQYQIYKATPFPQSIGANAEERFIVDVTPSYVGATPDFSGFLDLGNYFDDKICLPTKPIVCPAQLITAEKGQQKCLYQLLMGRFSENPKDQKCPIRKYRTGETAVVALSTEKWAISVVKPTKLRINCLNVQNLADPLRTVRDFQVKGNQILTLPAYCMANIDQHVIPLRFRGKSTVSLTHSLPEGVTLPPFLDYRHEMDGDIKKQFDMAYQELEKLQASVPNQDAVVEDILKRLEQQNNITNSIAMVHPDHHHWMYGPLWLIVGVGLIGTCYWWKRRKANHSLRNYIRGQYERAGRAEVEMTSMATNSLRSDPQTGATPSAPPNSSLDPRTTDNTTIDTKAGRRWIYETPRRDPTQPKGAKLVLVPSSDNDE